MKFNGIEVDAKPLLYTDSINGKETKSDHLWIVDTEALNKLTSELNYQTVRAEANWKALCECRGEDG